MARALLWGTATLGLVACTDGASERTITTTVPAATTTSFETLPPVGVFNYPTGSDDVIAQISVDLDAPVAMPLLTIYGSGRTIAAVDDQWRTGSITDLDLQDFFDDARSIGLLDDDLVLRGRIESEQPNIAVFFDVDGRRLNHELDLVRIERPASMRAFLQRAATSNHRRLRTGDVDQLRRRRLHRCRRAWRRLRPPGPPPRRRRHAGCGRRHRAVVGSPS
jgi:hypothetical protein